MSRGVKLIIATLFFLIVKMSWAVTFGPIHVYSYIGQPLLASIVLSDVDNIQEVQKLTVKLADTSIYNQLGVVKAPEQSGYRFAGKRINDKYYIVISSDKPINDSFIDFVLTINETEHKEFSAFLNPNPIQSTSNSAADIKNNTSPTSISKQNSVINKQSRVDKTKSGGFEGNRYGPIKEGESLYKIGEKTIPNEISKEQWVATLFHENPSAFENNNIDSLIRGSYLNLPEHKLSTPVKSASTANTPAIKSRPTNSPQLNAFKNKNFLLAIIAISIIVLLVLIIVLLVLIFVLIKQKKSTFNNPHQHFKDAIKNQENDDRNSDMELDKQKMKDSIEEQLLNNMPTGYVVKLPKNEKNTDFPENKADVNEFSFNQFSHPYSNNLTTETIKDNASNEPAMQINLDLAQVYIENNFKINKAKVWLNEVLERGNDTQQNIAGNLLKKIQ